MALRFALGMMNGAFEWIKHDHFRLTFLNEGIKFFYFCSSTPKVEGIFELEYCATRSQNSLSDESDAGGLFGE